MSDQELLIPARSVLVHIGPYKTGTTALQSSLNQHRDDLAAAGVFYPGPGARQAREGWSLLGRSMRGALPVPPEVWERLAAQVREHDDQRVCLSTEDLVSAGPEHIHRLVEDLGRDRVHMVMVARRLDKLIPSAWQQRVKSSYETRSYEQFVAEVLAPEWTGGAARTFWHNHGIAGVLERWRAELPADRITVVVADESDREQQARVFERMLGVPEGTLTPGPKENTSLTLPRVEFYRRLNAISEERGWDDRTRRQWLHVALLPGLMDARPAPDEARIPALPASTYDRLAELSRERSEVVRGSGVRVVGDPDDLLFEPGAASGAGSQPPEAITIEAAARAVESLITTSLERQAAAEERVERLRHRLQRAQQQATGSSDPLAGVSSRAMLREALRRQRARLGRRRPS